MKMLLKGKTIVLGVTGGIAAYKTAYFARLLVKEGAKVYTVMTASALELIGASTFQALTGNYVYTKTFDYVPPSAMGHIELSKAADLVVIAPATANTIAKLANGIADNLLTTVCLATEAPLLLCPAMNVNMWRNNLTQENVKKLLSQGNFYFCGPASGDMACGDSGEGRMSEPEEILQAVRACLTEQSLVGKKILVTAGPTVETLDAARVLTNRSTGKMGRLIAEEAALRGAEVTLISGPTSLAAPYKARLVRVESAQDMFEAVKREIGQADAVIMSAAVADYRSAKPLSGKLKKTEGELTLTLERTQDILMWLRDNAPEKIRVGFAAEYEDILSLGLQKLEKKGCHILVANQIGQEGSGFGSDTDLAAIIEQGKPTPKELSLYSKRELAIKLLEALLRFLQ